MVDTRILFIQIVSIFFGIIWTTINFYNYFPLVQYRIDRAVKRFQRAGREKQSNSEQILTEAEHLPTIDILIPAYEESAVIKQPIRTISQCEYPKEKFSISVLVEPHDSTTRETLDTLQNQFKFSVITIPTDYPGPPSKPRALNYAFEQTAGDIVTIIDAEDLVSKQFLAEAAAAVLNGADFGMARLDMTNEGDGWLNLMFRAEYGYWYNHVIPALAHVDFPIPLGGTGCFFQRTVLTEIAQDRIDRYNRVWNEQERLQLDELGLAGLIPWDPTHLTEDFELGLLLWLREYEFEYLNTIVREESPVGLNGWIRQRTRWNKGKLQAFAHFLVYRPRTWYQRFHIYWQSMLPHLGPVNLIGLFFVFWVANVVAIKPGLIVLIVLSLGLTFTLIVSLLYVRGYLVASDAPWSMKTRRAVIVGFTLLFYWFLQWLADLIALIDLRRGRVSWNKTAHIGRNVQEESSSLNPAGRSDESSKRTQLTNETVNSVETEAVANGSSHPSRSGHASTVLTAPISIPSIVISKAEDAANYDLVDTVSIRYEWSRRRILAALTTILIVGIILRLVVSLRWGMWLDEIYTVSYRTQLPLRELLYTPHDPHPPLYYLLMAGWIALLGNSHIVAVAFSLICSIGVMVGVFLWGRELYDEPTAVLGTAFIALSTLHVHFGRMVRMYSLFSLCVVFSWYYYTKLWRGDSSRLSRLTYVVTTVAMLYTHIFGIFVVMAQFIHMLLVSEDTKTRYQWLRLGALIGSLYLPWIVVILTQVLGFLGATGETGVSWIGIVSQYTLRETFLIFVGYPMLYPIVAGGSLNLGAAVITLTVFVLVAPFVAVTYYRDVDINYLLTNIDEAGLLVLGIVVPIGVPFVISIVLLPIYVPRYTVAASLPFFLFLARAIGNIPTRKLQTALITLLILTSLVGLSTYYMSDTKEDWRAATTVIESDATPGDLLIVQPYWILESVEYYYDGPRIDVTGLERDVEVPETELRSIIQGHDTVWLVEYQSMATTNIEKLEAAHEVRVVFALGSITVYKISSE